MHDHKPWKKRKNKDFNIHSKASMIVLSILFFKLTYNICVGYMTRLEYAHFLNTSLDMSNMVHSL